MNFDCKCTLTILDTKYHYQRKSIAILNYKVHSTAKTFTFKFSTVVNSGIALYVKMTIIKDKLIDAVIGV